MNKVKPTEKQRSTFEHIKRGMKLRDAMLAAGYDETTALNSKENYVEAAGVQKLMEEYRGMLIKNGATLEMLAELQIEGLFDNNGAVRLQYIKETKKDFGMSNEDTLPPTQHNYMIFVGPINGNT